MDGTVIIIIAIVTIVIWGFILKGIIKSATYNIIRLLILIAKKQGASEDEIFRATKTEDQILARDRKLKRELKKAEQIL